MDEHELAERCYALPGRFADRLDPVDLATVREYAEVGEWAEETGLLLACLSAARQPVTAVERGELAALLEAMGMPGEPARELSAADGASEDVPTLSGRGPSLDPAIMCSTRTGQSGDRAMTAARQYDLVRTTAAAESLFDSRTIPAGMEGVVLEAKPDGTCLAELAFTQQTPDHDGDFVLAELAAGQYKIIIP